MKKQIEIKPKKPRLAYMGMDKKTIVEAVPTQVVEVVYPHKAEAPKKDEAAKLFEEGQLGTGKIQKISELPKNRLIWTNDNLVALKTLLDEKDAVTGEYKYRNKIDLIYIDPPFMVQNDFVAENSIDIEVDEEEGVVSVKEPTIIETIAYKDTWQNGLDSFLQMMRERLVLMKELLAPTGSIYVHLDWHASHYVKVLMDEIFGYENFKAQIVWQRTSAHTNAFDNYGVIDDQILFYVKGDGYFWREQRTPYSEEQVKQRFKHIDKDGRQYELHSMVNPLGPTERPNLTYEFNGHTRTWLWSKGRMEKFLEEGKIEFSSTGYPYIKYYLDEMSGMLLQNLWADIPNVRGDAKLGYPTQKPLKLLDRLIRSSCPDGSLVLDAFMGSGTTCEAAEQLAEELNCTWIGIDNSKFAIHTARKRLIELNGKQKGKKGEGVYKARPFTVENMGYYQRGVKWDQIQVSKQADAYRQAIVELFGGEYAPYSKLLHGKKRGSWVHVGPLSAPLTPEQILAIAEEARDTEFKKVVALSADFTAHLNKAVEEAKEKFGVAVSARIIPSSAIEEVKKRLSKMTGESDAEKEKEEMPTIAFFAPPRGEDPYRRRWARGVC